jgi:hypothetical protein
MVVGVFCTTYPASHSEKDIKQIDYRGIVCVQYNANWNNLNRYQQIPGIKNYYVDIETDLTARKRLNIKSLPTLIVYKDGKEVKRIEANIMMKIDTPVQVIKQQINEIH